MSADLLRGYEVAAVKLAGRGLTNVEIAEQVGLSPYTIASYLRDAYRKLGVKRREDALGALRLAGLDDGKDPTPQQFESRRGRPRGAMQGNSFLDRIVQWAKDNPDDDLTFDDAAEKFDIAPKTVRARMWEAKQYGLPLEVVTVIRLRRPGS